MLGETQTLRAGRSNAEPKLFAPPQTPFPGAQDRQNLISWRSSLPAPTDTACPPQTPESQTGPITIHCAAKFSAQCNYSTLQRRVALC